MAPKSKLRAWTTLCGSSTVEYPTNYRAKAYVQFPNSYHENINPDFSLNIELK